MTAVVNRVVDFARAARRRVRRLGIEPLIQQPLSQDQLEFWERQGYLVLEGFFSPDRVAEVNTEVEEAWERRAEEGHRHVVDVYLGTPDERRIYLTPIIHVAP